MGVPVESLVMIAFGCGGALAGIAGLLMAPVTGASVFVGTQFALYGFVAMAIGGYGRFRGAVTGGFVVGLVTSLVGIEVSPSVHTLVLFGVLVVVSSPCAPRGPVRPGWCLRAVPACVRVVT